MRPRQDDHWGLQTPWIRGRGLHVQEQKILRPETGSFRYQGHDETRESGPTQRQDGVCPYTYPRYTQGRLLKATFMSSFIFAGKHEIIKTKSNSNVLGSFDLCVTSTCNLYRSLLSIHWNSCSISNFLEVL